MLVVETKREERDPGNEVDVAGVRLSDQRQIWVGFVGSLLCSERFFSRYSAFLVSSKTNVK